MTNPPTEFDSPWKEIIQQYFTEFIQFFFPQAYREIDWNQGFEFLDQELQQVVRDAELGKRLVDKLVKIYRSGQEAWVLIHIELQSQEETDFTERMFVYNYRIYDKYRKPVASLAILGDERENWRQNQFGYQLFGCRVDFQFPVVKLLDYSQQLSALETNRNPFATVVMAHLAALQTRNDRIERKERKLALIKRLYEFGFEREDIINLFSFIDWLMTLPEELQQEFQQQLHEYEEEKRMPYVTSVERSAILRTELKGLLEAIELGLELKFGSESLTLLPEISTIKDVEKLRAIISGIKTVKTLEELQQIYHEWI
ncbi:MAG TPA: cytosolic protein [Nostocaceae cyanobacterium]|nr:cytosolic protein [Nostocaceae cyanobacterium]